MDPTNFRFKIHEISAIGAKCYLNVANSAPDMKIRIFCKVLPRRAQNAISLMNMNITANQPASPMPYAHAPHAPLF